MEDQALSEENWKTAVHQALAKLPWHGEIVVKDDSTALLISIGEEDLGMIRFFRNFREQSAFWSDEDQEGAITEEHRSISAPLEDEPLIELSGHSAESSGHYLGRNTVKEFGKSVQLLVLVGLVETGIVSVSPLDGGAADFSESDSESLIQYGGIAIEDETRGYLYEIAERWMEGPVAKQARLYLAGEVSLPDAAKNCGLEMGAFQAFLEDEQQLRAAADEEDDDFDDDFDEDEDEEDADEAQAP